MFPVPINQILIFSDKGFVSFQSPKGNVTNGSYNFTTLLRLHKPNTRPAYENIDTCRTRVNQIWNKFLSLSRYLI